MSNYTFIGKDWKLNKKIHNFCLIPNHQRETIRKYVESCFRDWGIERIFTIIIDNANSNDFAIEYLTQIFMGNVLGENICIQGVLILNLIVNEGLRKCSNVITTVRNIVRYMCSSPTRSYKFKICAKKENRKTDCKKMLSLDVSIRWNSTYMM